MDLGNEQRQHLFNEALVECRRRLCYLARETRGGDMDLPTYLSLLGALLLCGCGESAAPQVDQGGAEANVATAPPAASAPQYEPWDDAGCYRTLKDRANGAHTAWVEANDYGLFLNTHIDAFETLPHATDLGFRLRADGDPQREIAAKGQRGDDESDSANYLSIILDQPQRRFVAGAKRIAVVRGEAMLIELPVDTLADLEPIAEECTPGAPGQHINE